ncbi:unnamed protein product, partial [Polarella glacialis]
MAALCEEVMVWRLVPTNTKAPMADRDPPVNLVLISDPGQDLDDEMAFIMLRYLMHQGQADVRGIIATLHPALDRARLARGTLDTLGLYDVPIGIGTDGGDTKGTHQASDFEEWARSYMPGTHSERASTCEPGRRLLSHLYAAAKPKSLTLVVIAALKDPAIFLRDNPELFVEKTREVVIMGGVEPWAEGDGEVKLVPDTAHNNMFDPVASEYFYCRCQELQVPLVVVSRWSAYAAKVPRSCYDELAAMGSSIGCRLRNAQRASIDSLWMRACSPAGGAARKGLPDRCDRSWFVKTFCGGQDDASRGMDDSIWDLLVGFMQYDSIAVLAALPQLRRRYFAPLRVKGLGGTEHLIIGRSEKDHNVSDPPGLAQLMLTGFRTGLGLNHMFKAQYILLSQPRWNNRVDDLLACVMLRALWYLGILDCAGIVLSPGPADAHIDPDEAKRRVEMVAEEIRDTLRALGLPSVRVLVADYGAQPGCCGGKTVADHLDALYDHAPPAGVSLVVTGCLGDVANFAERSTKVFRERTQRVILMGSALLEAERDELGRPTGQTVVVPDPMSSNMSEDMESADRLFRLAQELMVPLVVLSRHFTLALQVPRVLFDKLDSHGGALGKKLASAQREATRLFWIAACASPSDALLRRGLAPSCDREWFLKVFCNGVAPEGDDIWQ